MINIIEILLKYKNYMKFRERKKNDHNVFLLVRDR